MKKVLKKFSHGFILMTIILVACNNKASVNTIAGSLPRSIPEIEGVSSVNIVSFLKAIEGSQHEFHSFMFLRHGKVIAEGWWDPYKPELKHTLYSASKSFTSTAVGFAVTEKRLKVTDKVISFFPEYLPDNVSSNLADMEVRDLLFMSAGQEPDPTHSITSNDTNWVKAFLALPVINDPGTKFLYNSMATYMLSAIVQKVTGEKVIDYLKPRLFDPLFISGMDWETDPMGINTGGWGLRLKTEDMAKFGQFYLQKGKWDGRQLLPEAWISEATTSKIDQMPEADQAARDSSDWLQGYCYQFWRNRNNNGFRGDGAFGQFIIVMPEKDAVIAITAESLETQKELNLVWKYLVPGIKEKKLPENQEAYESLKKMLTELKLPVKTNNIDSPLKTKVSGKTYNLDQNAIGLKSIRFDFNDNICNVIMETVNDKYNFRFGYGVWVKGETTRPGPNLLSKEIGYFKGLPAAQVACSYNWFDENTLELTIRYIESPHTESMTLRFDKDKVRAEIKLSFTPKAEPVRLQGKIIK